MWHLGRYFINVYRFTIVGSVRVVAKLFYDVHLYNSTYIKLTGKHYAKVHVYKFWEILLIV